MVDSKDFSGIFESGLSYINIPGPPLSPLTLGQLVDEAEKKWSNSECLYDVPVDRRLTFSQLKHEVDWLASGLLKIGLKKGDRIGIWGPNSCQWLITFLAAAKVGIIIVPLNPGYEAPELLYALNYLSIKCLVLAEPVKTRHFYNILNSALPDMKILEEEKDGSPIISSILAPNLKKMIYMGNEQLNGTLLWADVQKSGKEEPDLEKMRVVAKMVQCDDILYLPFTSGSTGRPKGVKTSHHAHVNTLIGLGNRMRLTQEDRHCQPLPLFHLYGYLVATFPLCFGCSVVLPSPFFSPSAAIKITASEKCTWLQATPTMHFDMINVPGFDLLDLSALKGAVVGGAVVARKLLTQMVQKYRISKVTRSYGATEIYNVSHGRVDDPPELMFTNEGFPRKNSEIKIIDAAGRVVPVGEIGEICCRSPFVTHGYWGDPEKTRETIDSARWYHTGDAGYFLESGHLVITGRFKDIIIRGGENIFPKEIEDFLYENLQVEEVHVFGVADERLGEVVAAWVLPKPKPNTGFTMDADAIKRVCEGKISRSKIPVYIKIVQSKESFPWGPLRKVQKNVMRQQYEQELGLNNTI